MARALFAEPGIYWQSRMGNNGDGIGGNCHRYDIVRPGADGNLSRAALIVDYGIKFQGDKDCYRCSFPSPEGLFPSASEAARKGTRPAAPPAEALLLTHCHEDHIGAVRHAIDMGYRPPPVYCSAFTAEMLQKSLTRAGILDSESRPPIHRVAQGETLRLAGAEITFVAVDHLPGAHGILLRTPEASLFHSGDYKFDSTLTLGERADSSLLRRFGDQGVDLVIADSTSSCDRGAKASEAEIQRNLTRLVGDQEGRAVIAGILGSQLDRLVSLGRAATANQRALIVTGESLCENIRAAERAGIDFSAAIGAPLLMAAEGRAIMADRALVVTTGAFAQPQAGLTRAAESLPGALYVDSETTIIIPQRAIPPVAAAHGAMVAGFERMGARVITAENAPVLGYGPIHQSGHAVASDAQLLYRLLRPKQAVSPMHGAPEQIEANGSVAAELGIKAIALPHNGAILRVNSAGAAIVGRQRMERIAAAETGLVKQLPRARPGQGKNPPAPAIYRYDRMDDTDQRIKSRNTAPYRGPARLAGRQ